VNVPAGPLPGLAALPLQLTAPRYPATSRYSGVETTTLRDARGREVSYLRRRFCPDPDSLAEIGTYVVQDGDRLDRIAASTLGDPEQFWRLCDGNRALDPSELLTPIGRVLRITLPPGFPAPPRA
jgi:hypothetical protein